MKNLYLTGLCLVAVLAGCGKSTETIVVDDSGLLPGTGNKQEAFEIRDSEPADDFQQITLGEVEAITSLDPLFAQSNSELRAVNLVYDGLIGLDENGYVIPALATSWLVSRDSLRYTIRLRNDIFYHNSTVFTSGLGRKVRAADIEQCFLRMGSVLVPDYAADMFSIIKGFEAFHSEQTFVKDPAKRVLKSIEGLETPNDSTIVFNLIKKDPGFLAKLAHPHASIYPNESFSRSPGPLSRPVGTGPFYYVRQQDNTLILASNNDYYRKIVIPDRVDIVSGVSESELFQRFARDEIQALIEISPKTIETSVDENGELSLSYISSFKLSKPDVKNTFQLYFNNGSKQSQVKNYILGLTESDILPDARFGNIHITANSSSIDSLAVSSFQAAHTKNPFELFLLDQMAKKISANNSELILNSSYAITQEIALATSSFEGAELLLEWNAPFYILSDQNFSGISVTKYPWNISITSSLQNNGDN